MVVVLSWKKMDILLFLQAFFPILMVRCPLMGFLTGLTLIRA